MFGQTSSRVEYRGAKVVGKSLGPIAEAMQDPKAPPWPHLAFSDIGRKALPTGRFAVNPSYDVCSHFLATLRSAERTIQEVTAAELESRFSDYGRIANQLRTSGGYPNIVLGDAVRRVGIYLLASYAAAHPGSHAEVRRLLEPLRARWFTAPMVVRLIDEELGPSAGAERLHSISGKRLVDETLAVVGSDHVRIVQMMDFIKTSSLLRARFLDLLLWRLVLTDFYAEVKLSALIEFFQRGGMVDKIGASDVRPFYAVMAGAEHQFRYEPLERGQAYEDDLRDLIQMVRQGGEKAYYLYGIAIE